MAFGSFSTLAKNVKNFGPGLAGFIANIPTNLATYRKIKDRQWYDGPQHIKEQEEVFEPYFARRMICQHKNMWIDKDIDKAGVSREDLKNFMYFKMDGWRVVHSLFPLFVTGGLAAVYAPILLGNDLWALSTFPQNAEEKKQWLEAQDMNRYRWTPATMVMQRFWLDYHGRVPDEWIPAWEELFERNDTRRDVSKMMPDVNKMYNCFQPYWCSRRQQIRLIGRLHCMPTYPQFGKICLSARVKDYWELALTEDYMVRTNKLHESMSDEELHDYAWRRFLAPYDKNLTREDIMTRVEDYHAFLGPDFAEVGKCPNLFIIMMYCHGYYYDPAYLTGHISELEENDYEHLSIWAKSLFSKRLEFENGPLRDQVEAHSQKKIEARAAILKEAEAQLAKDREEACCK